MSPSLRDLDKACLFNFAWSNASYVFSYRLSLGEWGQDQAGGPHKARARQRERSAAADGLGRPCGQQPASCRACLPEPRTHTQG